ncbi:MAG: hypothetical protein JSV67_01760 [Thermoplasmatales archaeon]|nr:MAG: hypothetical protein JSV67_01760 [Thermoplasmatales archaeon]
MSKNVEFVEIYIFECLENSYINTVKKISVSKAIDITERIKTIEETHKSFNESFEQVSQIAKETELLTGQINGQVLQF